jgi:metal-responsive CopG/Arc/MetJ family transcriptional regulator
MHSLEKLQTQQVGLRLATHLVEEIDDLIKDYNINRTSFIAESIKEYIKKQKAEKTYQRIDESLFEVKQMIDGKIPETTLEDLIDELENN